MPSTTSFVVRHGIFHDGLTTKEDAMMRIDHERLYLSRSGAAELLGVSIVTMTHG